MQALYACILSFSVFTLSEQGALDARTTSLGCNGCVVTGRRVGCRGGTTRLRGVIHIIGVLVITVDDRGQARDGISRYPEVVVQIPVAGTANAALADTTKVNDGSRLDLGKGAARGSRAQILREVYIPGRA